ncbi:UPF0489 family protein [Flavobacterium sp.]|uniref:UPF0489 family protein n=1 Tax=Flavobacterium sp. TaxID=239 RepID=UPI0039E43B1B
MDIIINKGRNASGAYTLNLLAKDGKTFVMDNHLAAGWCWLQKLDTEKQYNLFHIDRHYDLLNSQTDWWINALQAQQVDISTISIEDLLTLQYVNEDMPTMDPYQIFRWDNYITILNRLYPSLFGYCKFATHKDGSTIDEIEMYETDPWDLTDNLSYWINEGGNSDWIVNLDIDYFFTSYGNGKFIQLFHDEYIVKIAKEIKKSMPRIAVFTIALSPEFCGGWKNAFRVLEIIADILDLDISNFDK